MRYGAAKDHPGLVVLTTLGTGLPPGSGTAVQGAAIYSQKCAICHGENGVNPARGYLPMVGPSKFDRIDTMKTVPYYKYATTLFDVTRRSIEETAAAVADTAIGRPPARCRRSSPKIGTRCPMCSESADGSKPL